MRFFILSMKNISLYRLKDRFCLAICMSMVFLCCANVSYSDTANNKDEKDASMQQEWDVYQEYVDFFKEVYDVVTKNYYKDVLPEKFDRFIHQFNTKIYPQLKNQNKSSDYIRWRSAAKMIDTLKTSEDVFSAFYPPEPAKEYEQTSLGKRMDLGIDGSLTEEGYETTQVEPRSDAYGKGLRKGDILLQIDDKDVQTLSQEEIAELLTPLENSFVKLQYLTVLSDVLKKIDVTTKEYFKQTVFMVDVNFQGIYCLEIRRFNRKTAEDLFRFIKFFKTKEHFKGLILDLRNNPGGPPLAAREISSFFLPPGEDFAYFQKKGQPKANLDVPTIPDNFHYDGPMVILVNEKSGSASELFSGVLQRRRRAVLMGQNSAGQVMLKSMFHFDDESMYY